MNAKIQNMLSNLDLQSPVKESDLLKFEQESRIILPNEYKRFLKVSNGGEGFIGENSYVIFWSINDLLKFNKAYNVYEYAPGLLLIGSDGGGEAYAFDTHSKSMEIVKVPFVGMSIELIEVLAPNFDVFIEKLNEMKDD